MERILLKATLRLLQSRASFPTVLLIVLGAIDAWAGWGSYLTPDAVSYMDMAKDIAAGHLAAAINGYWNPLYPAILAVFIRFVEPDTSKEFAVVRAVDFLIYLVTIGAFQAFLTRVLDRCATLKQGGDASSVPLSRRQVEIVGWSAFAWACLSLHSVCAIGADCCVMAVAFASLAALLSLGAGETSRARFTGFGVLLGIGYWAKTVMLPMGLVFLIAALFEPAVWRVRRRLLISAAALILGAAPLAGAISLRYGKPTFGESGKLNYVWFLGGVANFVNWQGGPRGFGSPVHSSRMIFRDPDAFEFGTPIAATYAPWYDPAYWYDGVRVRFEWAHQLAAILHNAAFLGLVLRAWAFLVPAGIFVLSLGVWRHFGFLMKRFREFAPLWIVCLSGLGTYLAVHVESRYFAPFLAPVPLLLIVGVRISRGDRSRAIGAGVVLSCVVAACLTCGPRLARAGESLLRTRGNNHDGNWRVAETFAAMGVEPGTQVAFIGRTLGMGWARLARLRVVAQVPRFEDARHTDENVTFWKSGSPVQEALLHAFTGSGARFVIANDVPDWADTRAWHHISESGFFYRVLKPQADE